MRWTATAKEGLKRCSRAVRDGLIKKIDGLYRCDPRKAYKPLTGPLQGYYRIPYSRYRAIFGVEEEETEDGGVLIHVKILIVAVGIRKERDKKDIYRLAQRLAELGMLDADETGAPD